MVRRAGLEPARPCGQEILSLSCLPIPSSAHRLNCDKYGGTYGSRTRLHGFADRCVTAPPTRHYRHIIAEISADQGKRVYP
jgi:hypothetical protein